MRGLALGNFDHSLEAAPKRSNGLNGVEGAGRDIDKAYGEWNTSRIFRGLKTFHYINNVKSHKSRE